MEPNTDPIQPTAQPAPVPDPVPDPMPAPESETVNIQADPLAPAKVPEPIVPQPAEPEAQPVEQPAEPVQTAAAPETVEAKTTAEVKLKLPDVKPPAGPSLFGYKPPKWANDFEYVRSNKGKGKDSDTQTWLLYMVDRLLKMHS